MIVIGELEAEGAERFAVSVQQFADLLAGGDRDESLRRQPGQNDVGTSEEEGFVDEFR